MNLWKSIWLEMRPHQWTKNILVYAALLFGGNFFVADKLMQVTMAFVSFCLVSSAVYFFNDIFDVAKDRQNPNKCHRPIAAGKLSLHQAYMIALLLCLIGIWTAYLVDLQCVCILVAYVIFNVCYTLRLKHVVIIDVMVIAVGFVLRAFMGAVAAKETITVWFFLCVMFLALFLALAKRRYELEQVGEGVITEGRKVLRFYSLELIDQLMTIVTAVLLICYTLFTVDDNTRNHDIMVYTVPQVLYGVFYYLYVLKIKHRGGAPDEALYKEKPILLVVLLYFVSIIIIRNS